LSHIVILEEKISVQKGIVFSLVKSLYTY